MFLYSLALPVDHRSLIGRPGIEIEIQGEDRRGYNKEDLARFGAKSVFEG